MAAFVTGANSQHCTGDHPSELQMLSRPLSRLRLFMPPTSLGSKSRPHSSFGACCPSQPPVKPFAKQGL